MATAGVRVPLAEYLSTEYEPDCEYVDGVLEDRNTGNLKHSSTMAKVLVWLSSHLERSEYEALPILRVRISASLVRIPDVCVALVDDEDEVMKYPPALWVEILSPEDRWSWIDRKLRELQAFGVPTIWVIDPYSREAWTASAEAPVAPAPDGILHCEAMNLHLNLAEVLPAD